jgi:ribosomal protein L11 methylase PrmA
LGDFVPDKPADVVAANILAVVLIKQREAVLSLARPGGYVILSGILAANYNEILEAFQPLGCVELERVTNEEWTSGLFRRP